MNARAWVPSWYKPTKVIHNKEEQAKAGEFKPLTFSRDNATKILTSLNIVLENPASDNDKLRSVLFRANEIIIDSLKEQERWRQGEDEKKGQYASKMKKEALQAHAEINELKKKTTELSINNNNLKNKNTFLTRDNKKYVGIVEGVEKQKEIRKNNPSAQKAWKNFRLILKLTK